MCVNILYKFIFPLSFFVVTFISVTGAWNAEPLASADDERLSDAAPPGQLLALLQSDWWTHAVVFNHVRGKMDENCFFSLHV